MNSQNILKNSKKSEWLFYIVAVVVVIIDQISKLFIRRNIEINESFSFWGIPMTHIENSGMAGGYLQGYGRLFGIVAVVFIGGVIYYLRTGEIQNRLDKISAAFLVGGAAGNGIDRLLFGQVTDFLLSPSGNGVLNMADHAIELGVLLYIGRYVIVTLKGWLVKRTYSNKQR